jgi:2-C-methyl-D-erythritol 4-phosphate cytidylyltransferase
MKVTLLTLSTLLLACGVAAAPMPLSDVVAVRHDIDAVCVFDAKRCFGKREDIADTVSKRSDPNNYFAVVGKEDTEKRAHVPCIPGVHSC